LTKLLRLIALIVISAAALLAVISAPDRFGNDGSNSRASQFESSQNLQNGDLKIFVPFGIHAVASAPLPFFVKIDPPQLVPPNSVFQIRGLPPGASLSEGHRVSADVWVVPIVGLSNLEIQATGGFSQSSVLTLSLVRADGGVLANAHTLLSILEPIGRSATVTADKETKAEEEREAAEAARSTNPTVHEQIMYQIIAEARRLAEAKAAEEARKAEAARKAAEAKKAEEEREAAEAARKAEEARRLAEAKAAEEARKAEAARKAADKALTALTTTGPAVAPSEAEELGAQVAGKEAERAVPRPSPVSQHSPDASVNPEPKLAAIPDRPSAAAEVTASAAHLSADRERFAKMIVRGEHELEAGNVSIARQFFLRAADGGLARGALLLAWTYDKNEFARLRIQGVTPNRELADKWYQRARELEVADKTGAR